MWQHERLILDLLQQTLAYLLKEKKLSQLQAIEFRKECGMMPVTIVAKISSILWQVWIQES